MFEREGSMFVRKLKRLVKDSLFSSLNESDELFNRSSSVSFCCESSCWICSMSSLIASSDTTAIVVVSVTIVVLVVLECALVREMPEVSGKYVADEEAIVVEDPADVVDDDAIVVEDTPDVVDDEAIVVVDTPDVVDEEAIVVEDEKQDSCELFKLS